MKVINGFRPACGSTYQVFNYGSRIGTFLSTTGTDLGGSLAFRPNYNVTNLVLEVIPVGPIAVVVSPSSATLQLGATQQFASTVTGTCNTAVIWSVQEGNSGGTVTTTGLYTAPQTPGTYHVVATSVADPGTSAAATVSVTASPALASKDKFQDDAGTTWKDGTGRSDDSASNPSPALASSCPNEPSVLATGQSDSWRMAADNSFVYWTSQTASDGAVLRVPICGGDVRVLASKQHDAYGIALDDTDGVNAYFATPLSGEIVLAPLDGGEPVVLASNQDGPAGIAVDSGNVYWVSQGAGTVSSVPIGGGSAVELARNQGSPMALALSNGELFWTNLDDDTIVCLPTLGGKPKVKVTAAGQPRTLVVNGVSIIWITSDGVIRKAAR